MAFLKVVEGSWIYNFPIHHILHFWRKTNSNRASLKSGRPMPRRVATSRAVRARAPHCRAALRRASVHEPPRAFPTQSAPSRGGTQAEGPESPRRPPARSPNRAPPYVLPARRGTVATRPPSCPARVASPRFPLVHIEAHAYKEPLLLLRCAGPSPRSNPPPADAQTPAPRRASIPANPSRSERSFASSSSYTRYRAAPPLSPASTSPAWPAAAAGAADHRCAPPPAALPTPPSTEINP
jgi:hypothetical protein